MKGMIMGSKRLLSFLLLGCLVFGLFVSIGCKSKGGYQDIALVKQATREIRRIRNALEEYKLDYSYYPSEGSDLKVRLASYLSKFSYHEDKIVREYSGTVLSAQNTLDQIINILSGCGRIKNEQIEDRFAKVQENLELYKEELEGISHKIPSIVEDVKKIQSVINDLNPEKSKSLKQDSLISLGDRIVTTVDSLIKEVTGEEKTHLQNIGSTFGWYKLKLLGKEPKKPPELYSPEGEITTLKGVSKDTISLSEEWQMGILELEGMIENYRQIESSINYCDFLIGTQKDINRALKLISSFQEKREKAKKAAVIVEAQAKLYRMADVLRDYRRKNLTFPEPNVNTDSLFHPYFIETTMSGEQIDRWEATLSWFSSSPVYKTKDPTTSFMLEAKVNNKERTSLACWVQVENQWGKILSSFSSPLIYTTPDSLRTYFIKARAKDSGKTWITDRPPIAKTRLPSVGQKGG
ncbi:hypothetical protein KAW65_02430 [candidate division WOR-3 bacterium]|nr:hypothetical protein [candidate division WOR-3 bacterium]